MRGNVVEALRDPTAEACIISEYLVNTFMGNKLLTLIDKYLRSPSGLFFECRGIARDVPITIGKIEVLLDFHIYNIIDFDLLLGYPLEKLHRKNVSRGSLDEKLRETASATATSCLENPMAKPHPNQNPLEKMMHVSPSPFSLRLQNLPLTKSTTRKKSFTLIKMNNHHHPRTSLNLFLLARSRFFLTMIEIQP
jgi:hypothetical protein